MALQQQQRWQVHRLPVPGGDELGQRYAHAGAIENLFIPNLLAQQQRWQAHRLPIPGGDELGQRYAHSGVIEQLVASGILTQAQRWQVGRLPIPDGDIDTIGDRYALAGQIQSLETGGATLELWDTEWFINPTWTALEIPQLNTGNIFAEIHGFSVGLSGNFTEVLLPTDLIRQLQFGVSSRNTSIVMFASDTHAVQSAESVSIAGSSVSTQIAVSAKSIQITAGISGIIIHGN